MDQNAFDRIAKVLGGAASRRSGLRAALGVMLDGAAFGGAAEGKGRKSGRAADARRSPKPEGPCGDGTRQDNACTKDKQCCTGYCKKDLKNKDGKGRCRCIKKGDPCKPSQTCCGGLTCTNGICGKAKSCIQSGQPCTPADACCGSDTCKSGKCTPPSSCVAQGKACTQQSVCCGGHVCDNSVCSNCVVLGNACTQQSTCCGGHVCDNSVCADCVVLGNACTQQSTCCGGHVCDNSVCADCVVLGSACTQQSTCCGGHVCDNSVCADCVVLGSACTQQSTCCGGHVCDNSVCTDCVVLGSACTQQSTCCGGHVCDNSVCTDCVVLGNACTQQSTCCGGHVCDNSVCTDCVEFGESCTQQDVCCGGNVCDKNVCTNCVAQGNACTVKDTCCGKNTCQGGTCQTPAPVATGQACDPDVDTCVDAAATCRTYYQGSPFGTYCVLPVGGTCTTGTDCGSKTCTSNVCVAEVCTVCASGCPYTTIQAALNAPPATGDVIRIEGGVYNEDLVAPHVTFTMTNCNGEEVTIKNVADNTRTLVLASSSNPKPHPTITIRNLIITGKGTPIAGDPYPLAEPAVSDGGIDAYTNVILDGTTRVTGCNWNLDSGGGVHVMSQDAGLTITVRGFAEVSNNYSGYDGGGIMVDSYANSGVYLEERAKVTRNYAWSDGGGIKCDYECLASMSGDSEVSHNRADEGGGLWLYTGHSAKVGFTMSDNARIVFNKVVGEGGGAGMFIYDNVDGFHTMEMHDDTLIAYNRADADPDSYAGGILSDDADIDLVMDGNALITRNRAGASGDGGGGVTNLVLDIKGNASIIDNTPDNCKDVTFKPGSKQCGV